MRCQQCEANKPKSVVCVECAEEMQQDAYNDGLEEGIRGSAVEVHGILCVNGLPLIEALAEAKAEAKPETC